MPDPSPLRDELLATLRRGEGGIDLARAALLVAAESDPRLRIDDSLRILDDWGATLKSRMEPGWNNLQRLARLRAFVYDTLGFRGAVKDYFDPRNAFLHEVLERRTGIPLTLAIVVLELGWRVGMPLEGVGFPSHFLVRLTGEPGDLILDPFEDGRSLHEEDLRRILALGTGGRLTYEPAMIASVGKRDMIVRLLHNLKNAFLRAGDDGGALAAVERLLALHPEDSGQRRDRGLLLARLGRDGEALAALRDYLAQVPAALDRGNVEAHIADLLRRIASMN